MSYLQVNPEGLLSTGARIASTADQGAVPSGVAVTPPAADPVSTAVTATFQARLTGIAAYSSFAAGITSVRGQMVTASATTYLEQERLNQAALSGSGGGGAAAAPPSVPTLQIPTIPDVPVPVVPAPPGTGKEIAHLIHGGPGPESLHSTAQQMRTHAAELRSISTSLRGHSTQLSCDWPSESGQKAADRVNELASWYDRHAEHAADVATGMDRYGQSFAAAKAKIPKPQQFQEAETRLQAAAAANANPANLGRYAPVVAKYQTELAGLHAQAMSGWADLSRSGGDSMFAGKPLEGPPAPKGIHPMDVPLSPASGDSNSSDVLDLTKIKRLAPGELGPYGYKELVRGSGVWYPDPSSGSTLAVGTPSLGAPKAPLDLHDIVHLAPGAKGPYGMQELIPGSGTWVPDPGSPTYMPQGGSPMPVKISDLVEIPKGTLAPYGSIEIAPGLWLINPPGGGVMH